MRLSAERDIEAESGDVTVCEWDSVDDLNWEYERVVVIDAESVLLDERVGIFECVGIFEKVIVYVESEMLSDNNTVKESVSRVGETAGVTVTENDRRLEADLEAESSVVRDGVKPGDTETVSSFD